MAPKLVKVASISRFRVSNNRKSIENVLLRNRFSERSTFLSITISIIESCHLLKAITLDAG